MLANELSALVGGSHYVISVVSGRLGSGFGNCPLQAKTRLDWLAGRDGTGLDYSAGELVVLPIPGCSRRRVATDTTQIMAASATSTNSQPNALMSPPSVIVGQGNCFTVSKRSSINCQA